MIDSCSNNSIEINLLECCEKDDFKFDAITAETEETDSAAGRVAAQLQDQTYKMFQRRRWIIQRYVTQTDSTDYSIQFVLTEIFKILSTLKQTQSLIFTIDSSDIDISKINSL